MKILHVLDHSIPLQSGYTFRTRNILRQQAALGWKTCHVTGLKHKADCPSEETVDGLHFYRTPTSRSLLSNMPVLNQLAVVRSLQARLEQVIELERPDILHAHSPALNGMAALGAARKHGLPVVYECRAFWEDAAVDHGTSSEGGLRYRLTRALETRVFRQAQAVTTICEGLRSDIVARGIEQSKVTVIPNAVDIDNFPLSVAPDAALRSSLNLDGKVVLGFIGSFYAYEGLLLLLNSLPEILRRQPNVVLLLVGGGPDSDKIQARIAELGLAEAVVCTGRVPHGDVQSYYSLVDIFAYPRLPMRLTELVTPLKPLEAMAQGKLVLASDVGGHKELIRHGENGFLFEAGSAAALADTVSELLETRERWPDIHTAGRAYVENERNWTNSVARYQSLYEALL